MTEEPTAREATAAIEVAVDPTTAFQAFTEEINAWWVRGPINFFDSARVVAMRVEPGVGGRILEVYDEATADALELARITEWEPGARLTYRSQVDDTQTEVRFEPADAGTRVTVRQYLLPDGEQAFMFWPRIVHWLRPWCERRAAQPAKPREMGRFALALAYPDPVAAARWLRSVFLLGSWDVDTAPEADNIPGWIELHVGDTAVIVNQLSGEPPAEPPATHLPWVFVDDLDAHLAHAKGAGAEIVHDIEQHGFRAYTAADLAGYRWTFAQARPTM